MAKQDKTTNNRQSSSFHSFALGFYLPDEEMVFNEHEQDDKDAIEWAESTGLIERQDATGLSALQVPTKLER